MMQGSPLLAGRALVLALSMLAATAATAATADDITMLCSGAMKTPVTALIARRDPGLPHIAATFATAGAIRARVAGGARPDVVVVPAAEAYAFMKAGLIDIATRRGLAETPVGVAVRAGAPVPDIATPAAFKAMLLAARKIVIVDPDKGTSGRLLIGLFKDLGIDDAVRDKLVKIDGGSVIDALAQGKGDVGLQQLAELQAAGGVRVVGPIPAGLLQPTRYDVAVMVGGKHRKEAADWVGQLHSSDAASLYEKAGFKRAY